MCVCFPFKFKFIFSNMFPILQKAYSLAFCVCVLRISRVAIITERTWSIKCQAKPMKFYLATKMCEARLNKAFVRTVTANVISQKHNPV